jgi:hypothetical protein
MTGTKRDWINKPVEFIQSGKNWWRWGSIVIAGIFVNFLLELTFGLIYKNYVLFTNAINYLQAINDYKKIYLFF